MTTLYKKQVQELNIVPNNSMRASLTKVLTDLDKSIGPPRIETIDRLVEPQKAYAVVNPGGSNDALRFDAVRAGAEWNDLTITYAIPVVDANANTVSDLAVSRDGLDITVQLKGTDAVAASKALTIESGQNAVADETVTIGSVVYTWKASPSAAYEVDIGSDADGSAVNLNAAIMASGTSGTTYGAGTLAHPLVTSAKTTRVVTVTARTAGTSGNGINISETMTQGSWAAGATVLSGGSNASVTIVTTAAEIDALIDADDDISALITPSNYGSDNGTGTVTVMAETAFTGGVDSTYGLDGHFVLSKNALHVSKGESDAETNNWKTIPFVNDGSQFTRECFEVPPIACIKSTGAVPVGATGEEDLLKFERNMFEMHILGAGQTITVPVLEADGLNIALDETADEGCEISQGILARSRAAFVVGTHACYFKCKFELEDVSEVDEIAVGFRKAEDYQAALDDYDEMAAFNVISGDIKTETILNNDTTTTTDTTDNWGDGETHTLEVQVDIEGTVSYLIDGMEPTAVAASDFVFDSGEVIVPFFHKLHKNSAACYVYLKEWEVGLL